MNSLPTNTLKQALAQNRRQVGLWVTFAHQPIAEVLADSGFDWLLFDMEHSPTDLYDVGLVEGSITTPHDVERIREVRKQCKVLIAIGACAVNGGLPAQRNAIQRGSAQRHATQRDSAQHSARDDPHGDDGHRDRRKDEVAQMLDVEMPRARAAGSRRAGRGLPRHE